MPYEPRYVDVDWSDDRYPPIPDERLIGKIRIRRGRAPGIWPEEYVEGDEELLAHERGERPPLYPTAEERWQEEEEREARLEEERAVIAALADELHRLREESDEPD